MAFKNGRKYAAECVAAELTHSKTGTDGIELSFSTEEGETSHTLWLTDRNRETVYKALDALGIADPSRFNPLRDLNLLVGARCSLKMGPDDYNGKTTIRVQWVNPPMTPVVPERIAAFFNLEKATAAAVVTDDDVPF